MRLTQCLRQILSGIKMTEGNLFYICISHRQMAEACVCVCSQLSMVIDQLPVIQALRLLQIGPTY